MNDINPRSRLLIGLLECERVLTLPLTPAKTSEWQMRKQNIEQLLIAFDRASPELPSEFMERSDRNAAFLSFVENGGAVEFRRTHG